VDAGDDFVGDEADLDLLQLAEESRLARASSVS